MYPITLSRNLDYDLYYTAIHFIFIFPTAHIASSITDW